MSKKEKLKPFVIECCDRLRKLVDLNAPATIVGAAAWHLYVTVLAAYGSTAASTMVQNIREQNLHNRGICSHKDCTNYVDRPESGICKSCRSKLGIGEYDEIGDDPEFTKAESTSEYIKHIRGE